MRIALQHTITITDKILTATQVNNNEILMLTSLAEVGRYKIKEQLYQPLFSVKNDGFDINAKSTIYSLDEIVVIVNDYKRHGVIHYPDKYNQLHLWRGEYHADISRFPIALFKNEQGIPHIIYGVDWNHIQIMNLNKLTWPNPYDYFYGKLILSPDNKMFLSLGWAWGSCDAYYAYNISHFLNNHRIADIPILNGEHVNRAACWLDEKTVAITYNPYEEGDDNATKDAPHEIHFYKVHDGKSEFTKKIKIKDLDIVSSEIYYSQQMNAFIVISDKIGIAIISLNGEVLYYDNNMNVDRYEPKTNSLIKIQDNIIFFYQLLDN